MTPFNPDSWLDLLAYVIIGIPPTLVAVAGFYGNRSAKKHRGHIRRVAEATLHEVANEHDTNLRDDIDSLAHSIRDGFVEIRRDIGGLREELRTERIERIEGDRPHIVRGRG